jgi:hypothetical protein
MSRAASLFTRLLMAVALTACAIAPGRAQQASSQAATKPPLAFKVDLVLTRFQGDKKISSLPFTLYGTSTPPRNQAYMSLRLGVDVPIGSSVVTRGTATPNNTSSESSTATHVDYRNVGTSIDCYIDDIGADGRYPTSISIHDSSIYSADGESKSVPKVADPLAFRTFEFNNKLLMKDGQTAEFISAADKISGDVLKVNVTLTVMK